MGNESYEYKILYRNIVAFKKMTKELMDSKKGISIGNAAAIVNDTFEFIEWYSFCHKGIDESNIL